MERLVGLLNQYEQEKLEASVRACIRANYEGHLNYLGMNQNYSDLLCISKGYGFIKWLVENDKIDLEKVEKKFYNEICITDWGDKDRAYGKSDLVISVLSISDTPIDDLILYLK